MKEVNQTKVRKAELRILFVSVKSVPLTELVATVFVQVVVLIPVEVADSVVQFVAVIYEFTDSYIVVVEDSPPLPPASSTETA